MCSTGDSCRLLQAPADGRALSRNTTLFRQTLIDLTGCQSLSRDMLTHSIGWVHAQKSGQAVDNSQAASHSITALCTAQRAPTRAAAVASTKEAWRKNSHRGSCTACNMVNGRGADWDEHWPNPAGQNAVLATAASIIRSPMSCNAAANWTG
jgi:hypothetical protein